MKRNSISIRRNRQVSFIPLWYLLPLCGTLFTCDNPSSAEPGFTNMSPLAGKRFVAYVSPNRKLKPDTVHLEWEFSGLNGKGIFAEATIDSGNTWIPLDNRVTYSGNAASLVWVPGNDTSHFNYFGEKQCVISIQHRTSSVTALSDTFTIIGPVPVILDTPETGASFSIDDTVIFKYRTNSDHNSQFRFFFMHDAMDEWMEQEDDDKVSVESALPMSEYTLLFVPAEWDTLLSNHIGEPVRFMLKDYKSPLPTSTVILEDIYFQSGE